VKVGFARTGESPVSRLAIVLLLALFGSIFASCQRREVIIPDLEPPLIVAATARAQRVDGDEAPLVSTPVPPTVVVRNTPAPTPTRVPPDTTATVYTVRAGDTLSRIAALYATTTESLMQINGLTNPDMLTAGQELQVSLNTELFGPATPLLPDSEVILGPGYSTFDLAGEIGRHPGLLAHYEEMVNGRSMTGVEIVSLVARQYSVGPRVLLALLELRGGWLSNLTPDAGQQIYPLGYTRQTHWAGLYFQLCQAANALNIGFYGWWLDELWLIQTADGGFIQFSTDLNAGTAGVQKVLADTSATYETWIADLDRFQQVYASLFGDPFSYAVEPLIHPETDNASLELPWAKGQTWYYTGGPHPGWGSLGAFSAVDFVTDEVFLGCAISQGWVTASAPGLVVMSEDGMVLQDLDGDGDLGTGWVILYMHIASENRVPAGTWLETGQRVGHPSCEGGVSGASHLHIARRLNGVWIPTDHPQWPMSLSGWVPIPSEKAYSGTLVRDGEVRRACECWEAINAVTH
jgi:LasA protease